MKVFFYIAVVLFCFHQVAAQNNTVDSLKTLLSHEKNDTLKIKLLDQLVEIAPDGEWEAYNNQLKALVEQKTNSSSVALKNFYIKYLAIALGNEGLIYNNKGDVKKSINDYEKSLALSQQINDPENIARTSINLGRALYRKGNILNALAAYEESLKLHVKFGDKNSEAFTLNLIAELYRDQGDLPTALEYYQKGLKINEDIKDQEGITYSLNGIGSVYELQGKTQEALACFNRSLQLSEQNHNANGTAAALNDIGIIYMTPKDADKAIIYLKKSLRILEQIQSRQNIIYSLQNIGASYSRLNKDDSAAFYLHKSLELALDVGNPEIIYKSSNGLYVLYKKQGHIEKALSMYELSNKMRDSIYNDNSRKAAIRSQFKYEYEKKAAADSLKTVEEKKLTAAILKQEKTQRYALILSLILVLLIGFILFQRVRHNQRLKESRLRNKIASDLHDEVGSSLSSISMYAGVAKMNPDQTNNTIVEKIEHTSRETIENMSDIVWSIQPKNDDFLNVLQKMENFGNSIMSSANIQFSFSYDGGVEKIALDIEQRKNVYLIYKEAINNSAKYSRATTAQVTIEKTGKAIVMRIHDNGIGIDLPKNNGAGNGLQNMAQRAKDIHGKLEIITQPNEGTTIQLQFRTT